MKKFASIKSIASYIPENCISNEFFTSFLDTSDEWITQRTGIKTRYFANKEQNSSDLGYEASIKAIHRAGLKIQDIDLILCATLSPDYFAMPSTACIIASKLGISNVPSFDIMAACSGFIYLLSMAKAFIESNLYNNILIVGAEKISSILDFNDRGTCILFGDGAGACVIGNSEQEGIKDVHISSDGNFKNLLYTPNNKTSFDPREYLNKDSICENNNVFMKMKGNEVFKIAVKTITNDAIDILKKNNLTPQNISYLVPHQANLRIISSVANALQMDIQKVVLTVHKYGNTSSASIPMAINDAYENGLLKPRDLLLLDAFGGGFTWGSALIYVDFIK